MTKHRSTDSRLSPSKRGYNRRWARYRKLFLQQNPFCAKHRRMGKTAAATVVDHIKPHKGDDVLFWDPANHQALCKPCHDIVKQSEERRGVVLGAGSDGRPTDSNHHWNR